MRMSPAELEKMMTDVLVKINAPYIDAVREALDIVKRIEERTAYAERITRLETRLDELVRRLDSD
jgi:hypothetical protein